MSASGFRTMTEERWRDLCEQLPPECSVRQVEEGVVDTWGLGEEERAALWLYVWAQRGGRGHAFGEERPWLRGRPTR